MKLFNHIKNIYFLGIGGIGMSALAQYFVLNKKQVGGYDKSKSKITEKLISLGIQVNFQDEIEKIPTDFLNAENTLIIYTPAIPEDLKILEYFKNKNFQLEKRAVVLGKITKEMPTLAVAGTHGKTTTSAILAHLLKQSGYKITAFLGGITENYQSNFIYDGKEACVVEADEYDRSFLQLFPDYAAITSMDADHLDIYENEEELNKTFYDFTKQVSSSEKIFYKKGLSLTGKTVAIEEKADFSVENIKINAGKYQFDLKYNEKTIEGFEFILPGKHNLMNAGMALAMALDFGAEAEKLKAALQTFKGVDRRFSYRLETENLILIEDYAHHPEEIKAVYQAAKEMFAAKKLMVIFQPHLYSRTQSFAKAFAKSLSAFDQVVLLPVFPAREKPIPGIDSAYLLSLIKNKEKTLIEKTELFEIIKDKNPDVVLMLGAGDIGKEVEPLINQIYEN